MLQDAIESVLHCSTIGVRSGKYAQQLIDQGLPHVYNLKGSIVAWVWVLLRALHDPP